ncbi:hypothetical protein QE152_g33156 [Popillia japonica]|uniref:Uncharacterized protein n=1 Tax=Popillia japonica TaxID=7064 RepID=A0AAW1IXN5_POPJA
MIGSPKIVCDLLRFRKLQSERDRTAAPPDLHLAVRSVSGELNKRNKTGKPRGGNQRKTTCGEDDKT